MPGLYAAGDMASVPHNYMLGAFVYGGIAGEERRRLLRRGRAARASTQPTSPPSRSAFSRPPAREDGLPPHQIEYKTRRLVNDYLQPPKITAQVAASARSASQRCARTSSQLMARDPHELMRALEAHSILRLRRDGGRAPRSTAPRAAGASTTCASTIPRRDDENWFCHSMHYKDDQGRIAHRKRPIDPYIVPIAEDEMSAYHHLRIKTPVAAE